MIRENSMVTPFADDRPTEVAPEDEDAEYERMRMEEIDADAAEVRHEISDSLHDTLLAIARTRL